MHTAMTNTLTNLQDCSPSRRPGSHGPLDARTRTDRFRDPEDLGGDHGPEGEGRQICNLTVGDFSPAEFRIPAALEQGIAEMLAAGQTNYPPRTARSSCAGQWSSSTKKSSVFPIRSSPFSSQAARAQ